MVKGCGGEVAYVDEKGFVYCVGHGVQRQERMRCRKLRPHELRRLVRGEQLDCY